MKILLIILIVIVVLIGGLFLYSKYEMKFKEIKEKNRIKAIKRHNLCKDIPKTFFGVSFGDSYEDMSGKLGNDFLITLSEEQTEGSQIYKVVKKEDVNKEYEYKEKDYIYFDGVDWDSIDFVFRDNRFYSIRFNYSDADRYYNKEKFQGIKCIDSYDVFPWLCAKYNLIKIDTFHCPSLLFKAYGIFRNNCRIDLYKEDGHNPIITSSGVHIHCEKLTPICLSFTDNNI